MCGKAWRISRKHKVLGYEPVVGLEEGVRRTIDYYRQLVTQPKR